MTNSTYGTPTPDEAKIYKELLKDFDEATQAYLKAEKELADEANGFFPKHLFDNVSESKLKFQSTSNSYHEYLGQMRDKYKM